MAVVGATPRLARLPERGACGRPACSPLRAATRTHQTRGRRPGAARPAPASGDLGPRSAVPISGVLRVIEDAGEREQRLVDRAVGDRAQPAAGSMMLASDACL